MKKETWSTLDMPTSVWMQVVLHRYWRAAERACLRMSRERQSWRQRQRQRQRQKERERQRDKGGQEGVGWKEEGEGEGEEDQCARRGRED